ncbi:MAG: hypothetical protein JJE09_07315 [Bacteroidia bacterium]|nr:hypothetical protein [Bacteroidia bacterium]
MISHRHVTILILFLSSLSVFAQVEGTLHYMNSLPQVVINNPAFVPSYKFSLGLPFSSLHQGYTNNGFSYNDLVTRKDGQVNADLSKWIKNLPDKTYIAPGVSIDFLRLGFRVNSKLYVTANVTGKEYGYFVLPKDLAAVFVEGNASYVNSTINISPLLEAISYVETAVGASYEVNKKLTVGGRVKLLHGIASITTQTSDISIAVDENYYLTASADLNVKSSGVNGITGSGYEVSEEWRNYLKNRGLAIDIGATYRLLDKLTLNASLTDIGSIGWNSDLYQYTLDKSKANYTFSGINLTDLVNGSANDYMDAQMDSLKNNFELQEGVTSSFRTALPGKMFLGGNFEVMRNFSFGTVFYAQRFQGKLSPGWTTSLNKNFGSAISTTLSYTMSSNSFNNLGAGLSFNLTPFQLYIVGDNLLRIPSSLIVHQNLNNYINTAQVMNVRLGLNFVFGRDKRDQGKIGKAKTVNSKNSKTRGKKAQQTHIKVRQSKR